VPVECGHLLALQGGVSAHAGDQFVRVTVGGPELRRTHLTALLRLGGWVVGGAARISEESCWRSSCWPPVWRSMRH